jgi:transcriptional regulator GlxA family with amidase domain
VEAARHLLSESRLPVKRIAPRYGFGTEETLRRSFLRLLAVTPRDSTGRDLGGEPCCLRGADKSH